jgi:hypothetical protein
MHSARVRRQSAKQSQSIFASFSSEKEDFFFFNHPTYWSSRTTL